MPTLQRFGRVSIRIYADDHRPPHFHIVGPDFQVVVIIADLTVKPELLAAARQPKR